MESEGQKRPVVPVGVSFRSPVPDDIETIQAGWIDQYRQYDPKRVRLLARVDGQLIGCVDSLISPNGVAGISYISVLPDYRRQGLGSTLLREAARVLKQRGATSMFAPIVPRKFYEVNGWRVNREYVVMARLLPPPATATCWATR